VGYVGGGGVAVDGYHFSAHAFLLCGFYPESLSE
jgi:hypothetical protein